MTALSSCVIVYLPGSGSSNARVVRLQGSVAYARSAKGQIGMNTTFPGIDEAEWVEALEETTGRDFEEARDGVERLEDAGVEDPILAGTGIDAPGMVAYSESTSARSSGFLSGMALMRIAWARTGSSTAQASP